MWKPTPELCALGYTYLWKRSTGWNIRRPEFCFQLHHLLACWTSQPIFLHYHLFITFYLFRNRKTNTLWEHSVQGVLGSNWHHLIGSPHSRCLFRAWFTFSILCLSDSADGDREKHWEGRLHQMKLKWKNRTAGIHLHTLRHRQTLVPFPNNFLGLPLCDVSPLRVTEKKCLLQILPTKVPGEPSVTKHIS